MATDSYSQHTQRQPGQSECCPQMQLKHIRSADRCTWARRAITRDTKSMSSARIRSGLTNTVSTAICCGEEFIFIEYH